MKDDYKEFCSSSFALSFEKEKVEWFKIFRCSGQRHPPFFVSGRLLKNIYILRYSNAKKQPKTMQPILGQPEKIS